MFWFQDLGLKEIFRQEEEKYPGNSEPEHEHQGTWFQDINTMVFDGDRVSIFE